MGARLALHRKRPRRGMVIPLVVGAVILFGLYAAIMLRSSKGEYRLVKKTIDRERARMIARAGMARATALIYQNDFEERWFKQSQGPHGYYGVLEGTIGAGVEEGYYRVVAEDVANELPEDWQGDSPAAKARRIENLTYNRIDLFAEGVFGDTRVVMYQAVVLHPEENVYDYEKAEGTTTDVYTNVRVR